jgi:membrane protein implicated in regulation of membrane protease activity
MAPTVGRIAFTIGVFLVILSLIPLPFLPVGSAEFVVSVIAFVLSSIFLALVIWNVRRQVRLPSGKPEAKPPDMGEGEED